MAALLDPLHGRTHNQVAVLTCPTALAAPTLAREGLGDWLSVVACYHYLRALTATRPFVGARENLLGALEPAARCARVMHLLQRTEAKRVKAFQTRACDFFAQTAQSLATVRFEWIRCVT